MLTINSENSSSIDHFESKYQANISPSDQNFEKQEEEVIEFKQEHHDELRIFYQYPFKIKCLSSTLKIHLLQITLRANHKLRFIHLIIFLKYEEDLIYFKE